MTSIISARDSSRRPAERSSIATSPCVAFAISWTFQLTRLGGRLLRQPDALVHVASVYFTRGDDQRESPRAGVPGHRQLQRLVRCRPGSVEIPEVIANLGEACQRLCAQVVRQLQLEQCLEALDRFRMHG